MDDSYCDPRLRSDSLLGVPGLVDAVRSGSEIDNALEATGGDCRAYGFLPGLCRQLLGDELKMPSVATWWCIRRSRAVGVGTFEGSGCEAFPSPDAILNFRSLSMQRRERT
jgi:uncharacterized circularly permuted ATP-grasp superfamily protein